MSAIFNVMRVIAIFAAAQCFGAQEKKAGEGKEGPHPNPIERTFYLTGLIADREAAKITAALSRVESVTSVKELTSASGYVRVAFDSHKIASHLIAQTIMDQGPYIVSQRFVVAHSTANSRELDALFVKLLNARQVKIEATDRSKGEFKLTFLPISPDLNDLRKVGFSPGHLGHPIHDQPPRGLGLTWKMIEAPQSPVN